MDLLNVAFAKLSLRERKLAAAIVIYDAFSRTSAKKAELASAQAMLTELETRKPASLRQSPLWGYREENKGLGNLIRKVSSSETLRDFTVRRINLEKEEKLPEYDKTKFQIEVEGPFHSIGNFLEELESSRFLTRVESVQVFRIEKELRLCRARIYVNSFTWKDL
jgi:Tfp pilus assembly protein PilO